MAWKESHVEKERERKKKRSGGSSSLVSLFPHFLGVFTFNNISGLFLTSSSLPTIRRCYLLLLLLLPVALYLFC
jgi:hypothetical protein